MKQEDFVAIINVQNEKNTTSIKKNYKQVIESEFMLSNVVLKHLEFLEKSKHAQLCEEDIKELLEKSGPLTKKTAGFDISMHMIHQEMYLHKHTYIEMDYVYKGNCMYYIDNEKNKFKLEEKQLCIVNQNVVHGIETLDEESIIIKCMIPFEYIQVDTYFVIHQKLEIKNFLVSAITKDNTDPCYLLYQVNDYDQIEELLYKIFCEIIEKEIGWKNAIKNHISNLFLFLMRKEKQDLLEAKIIKEDNFNITKLMECMRKNYQSITLKDLAKDFHFHENYLSRVIKEQCQVSFRELLLQIRLKEAENLLLQSNLSVKEIAEKIGYQKPNFFFKAFKEHYDMTPLEYRKEYKKKENKVFDIEK